MAFHPNAQQKLLSQGFSPLETFRNSLAAKQPWDSIIEFATSDKFCGKRLYPRQVTLLRLIYLETEQMTEYDKEVIESWRNGFKRRKDVFGVQPDIWDRVQYLKERGYRRFPHVQAVLGRRASKGMIGGVLGAEQIAYFYSLDDWQAHYGIDPGQDGYLSVVATNQSQAQRFQFADIRRTVENCKYLRGSISTAKEYYFSIRTPADVRRIAELKTAGTVVEHEIATLRAIALSSNSAAGRGGVGFANFYDEMAHMVAGTGSTKTGEEIYGAWQPSLDQFGKDALTYIPSSPFTKIGAAFELYKHGSALMASYLDGNPEMHAQMELLMRGDPEETIEELIADPEMLVFQGPSWILYEDWEKAPEIVGVRFKRPIQSYDTRMQRLEKRNPEKFKVERRGQWAEVEDAYLDPDKVDEMFMDPEWRDPLEPQDYGMFNVKYRIHCDPSSTNANFALAVAHLEEMPKDDDGEIWPCVIIDYLKVWKPGDYPDHTVPYIQIRNEISELLRRFPSTTKISFDQWQSIGMIADLRAEFAPRIRVVEETFLEKNNQIRCERFKSALNLGWVKSYLDNYAEDGNSLLEQEMKFLSEKNGKVTKQDFGPCTTKDLFDAVAVVTTDLLRDALDRWMAKLAINGAYGSTDSAGIRSGRELERLGSLAGGGLDRRGSIARELLARQTIEKHLSTTRMNRQEGFPTRGRARDAGLTRTHRPDRRF